MPKLHNLLLWDYFEPNPDNKIANCKKCNKKLSYKTTIANLKQHLRLKHVNAFNKMHAQDLLLLRPKTSFPRSTNLLIWNYFEKKETEGDKIADCRLCKRTLSYKTTIGNLKQHLKIKHSSSFKELLEQGESVEVDSCEDNSTSSESDDVCDELLKVTDVWGYFDTEDSGKRAQCTVCRTTLGNEYDELKAHLKDNHPKLLLELMQNKESDAASNDGDEDNENTYTEIVYLEQEQQENVTKHKEKPKTFTKPMKKRERLHSLYSSDDIPLKKAKKEDENDELGTFIKYITCLLKKLPADVFSNVQIEIINTILKANSQASTANTSRTLVLNKELINTSSNIITVDGITPISSTMMGHNYTITVAQPKESETENGDCENK